MTLFCVLLVSPTMPNGALPRKAFACGLQAKVGVIVYAKMWTINKTSWASWKEKTHWCVKPPSSCFSGHAGESFSFVRTDILITDDSILHNHLLERLKIGRFKINHTFSGCAFCDSRSVLCVNAVQQREQESGVKYRQKDSIFGDTNGIATFLCHKARAIFPIVPRRKKKAQFLSIYN